VRAPQGTRFEALVRGGAGQLGHRLLRVHAAGAGQSHRLRRDVARPAQDPAGSDHADGVRAVRGVLHEGTAEARLPVGGLVHAGCGVLHLQGLGAGLTMAPCRRGVPSSTSVQTMCAALPRSTIFGKPVALPRPCSSATCRRWYSRCRSGLRRDSHSDWPLASSRIHSSQAWCASTATATRPSTGCPCSSTTGGSKLSPASVLRAASTVGVSLVPVYQATTRSLPSAAADGPFTGHPSIFQPSACTGFGSLQAPST